MIKIKMTFLFFYVFSAQLLVAGELPLKIIQEMSSSQKLAIENALIDVENLLPRNFIAGLPKNIELKFEKLSNHKTIPNDLCSGDVSKKNKAFVYGAYHHDKKLLILNTAVFSELVKGKNASEKVSCQHKSLYAQSIATIVHELTHAYDFNNDSISRTNEYLKVAGFKKGLLKTKNKNKDAMRSADLYELTSATESYAVNMEYFLMDQEFACRKPAMFEFFSRTLNANPYPSRICEPSYVVMMSTSLGYYPIKLDPARVYRIDYLLASPGSEFSSGFGHSMFRIVLCAPERFDTITNRKIPATPYGPKCLEDRLYHMVVSYRANVEDATLNHLKGLFGGYPSMLFILNFGDVLDEYNRDELRDIVSYPLSLGNKEKKDFINKVVEEHWNYRGAYKFVTNNCAVESYDLLKNALLDSKLQGIKSITPKGVLEDLDKLEYLTVKSSTSEIFKARTDQLISAFKEAFTQNSKNDKKVMINFILKSSHEERLAKFRATTELLIGNMDLHAEVSYLKKMLVKTASFSVLEQQVLRTKTAEFRKKAAELFMDKNNKNGKIKKILENNGGDLKQNREDLAVAGYGVPLQEEIASRDQIEKNMTRSSDSVTEIESILKEIMPEEIAILEAINKNILVFNNRSLKVRKIYRDRLNIYVHQVLSNLALEENSRNLLISSLSSKESMNKVRELLDNELVSEREILDSKIARLIEDILH